LNKPELCAALGFKVLSEFDDFLKAQGVFENYTVAGVHQEVEDVFQLGF
jgi:hypothetical protein